MKNWKTRKIDGNLTYTIKIGYFEAEIDELYGKYLLYVCCNNEDIKICSKHGSLQSALTKFENILRKQDKAIKEYWGLN